jgi:hypothetical protein
VRKSETDRYTEVQTDSLTDKDSDRQISTLTNRQKRLFWVGTNSFQTRNYSILRTEKVLNFKPFLIDFFHLFQF